jgi:hypothetical protein
MAMVAWLSAPDASALLLEKVSEEPVLTVFYPYPTAFFGIDAGYAFDDDPLSAIVLEPFSMPLKVQHVRNEQSMVEPRMSFVDEMVQSGDAI